MKASGSCSDSIVVASGQKCLHRSRPEGEVMVIALFPTQVIFNITAAVDDNTIMIYSLHLRQKNFKGKIIRWSLNKWYDLHKINISSCCFKKRLSMSPEVTLGDNYIFAVFDLIFYYCHQDWANNAL